MSQTYTTIDDVISLWRPLTPEEQTRATALIPVVEDTIRMYARQRRRDLDAMIAEGAILLTVFKSVVVQVVGRTLTQDTAGEAMSQMSQSAGGYSVSGTFLIVTAVRIVDTVIRIQKVVQLDSIHLPGRVIH